MTDTDAAFDDLKRRATEEAARRLFAAAVLLQAEAKRDYSRSNPAPHGNPAPKGEFPRGRTWNLRDGIAIDAAGPAEVAAAGLRVRVGYLTGASYGGALSRRGWLGVKDTYARVRDRVARLMGG